MGHAAGPEFKAQMDLYSDDAEKSTVNHTVFMCSKQYLHNTKREDPTKSTDVVPGKYPPTVKLELFTTLECQS